MPKGGPTQAYIRHWISTAVQARPALAVACAPRLRVGLLPYLALRAAGPYGPGDWPTATLGASAAAFFTVWSKKLAI